LKINVCNIFLQLQQSVCNCNVCNVIKITYFALLYGTNYYVVNIHVVMTKMRVQKDTI